MDTKTDLETKQKSLRAVRNFCFNHSKEQMEEMLNLYYLKISAENPDPWEKHRILEFFESLEELLPAIYDLEDLRKREYLMAERN